MRITERDVDGVTVLDIEGKMLIGEGDERLRQEIERLTADRRTKVVLNMSAVPHVDSAGLGEITRSFTNLSRASGRLKLAGAQQNFQSLLAITKLLSVFEIYNTVEEACASFAPRAEPAL